MSYEMIAILMFSSMMVMLLTGQRVFGAIGFVGAVFSLFLWGDGGSEMPFNAAFVLMNWYPLLTLPLFIFMGYMLSESGIAGDLYRMFHVWMGPLNGGLAIGTVSDSNGCYFSNEWFERSRNGRRSKYRASGNA